MVVDNAASCVVTAVNTYQRRYAVQAARDVRTWKLVAEQVIEGTEHDEVAAELVKARDTLKEAVRKAFRHYAYLTRKGDQLDVVFARFDDDKQTTLSGNDVWSALVLASRAVGEYFDPTAKVRKRKPLAEEYLAILLAGFDRHLTLRDVVSSFYKNPRFPMVPTLDDIRGAIFKMLQAPDHAGPGTGGWELVGSDGSPIQVINAQEIAINSLQQQIRKRRPAFEAHADFASATSDAASGGGLGTKSEKGDDPLPASTTTAGGNAVVTNSSHANATTDGVKQKADSYSWYTVELENRSIVDEAKREDIRNHLRWLAAQLDNDQLDHQLITLKYEIMAGANPGLAADVKARANALDAKVEIRDEEI